MEIVNQDGRTVSNLQDDKSNVKDYLREVSIKDGLTLVPNYFLYYHYCKEWKPTGKKLSKIGFLRKISIVFESKRTKNTRYYLLSGEAFNLNEESLNDAKEFDRRYRAKKEKQKKQSKASSITEKVQPDNETGLY